MAFNSAIFLFLFLPCFLFLYFVTPNKYKNFILLLASLCFYAWGANLFLILLLLTILGGYATGVLIEIGYRKVGIATSIILNLSILGYYKYLNFGIAALRHFFNTIGFHFLIPTTIAENILPLGISFFVFKIISYNIDVYGGLKAEKNIIDFACYVTMFTSLVSGPLERYSAISIQLKSRSITTQSFSAGINRFVIGFAKKVLIANTLAPIVDQIFLIPADHLNASLTWLGITCYSLQIYYDFSGYTDMAIGLGAMMGFSLTENFNYPYASKSIQEFWNRWHISLSQWFRDYVFYPLEKIRNKGMWGFINLLIVFGLCGLWHGASWNFIAWGLYYGFFLGLERLFLGKALEKTWIPLRHIYSILIIVCGWVIFRAESLSYSIKYLNAMLGLGRGAGQFYYFQFYLNNERFIAIALALLGIVPIFKIRKKMNNIELNPFIYSLRISIYLGIFAISLSYLANSTYNSFIYAKF